MKLTEEQLLLIQKYLGGNLSGSDKSSFDVNLKNKDFRNALISQAHLLDSLAEMDTIIAREQLQEIRGKEGNSKTSASSNKSRSWILLTFLLLAAIGALLYFQSTASERDENLVHLAEVYSKPFPIADVSRGETTGKESLTSGMVAYANQDYLKALELLNAVETKSDSINLYIANCHIQLGEYQKGKSTLKLLDQVELESLAQNRDWYNVVCDLGLNHQTSSVANLERIINNKSHLFREDAMKLLREIRSE